MDCNELNCVKVEETTRWHSPSMITALSSSSPCWTSSNDDSETIDLLFGLLASMLPEINKIVTIVCMTSNSSVVSDDARCRRFIPRETETSEIRTRNEKEHKYVQGSVLPVGILGPPLSC